MTAREVVVLGKVRGNVSATDRVDIRAEGALSGDVAAARISIEDGAFFKGGIDIRKPDASRRRRRARRLTGAGVDPDGRARNAESGAVEREFSATPKLLTSERLCMARRFCVFCVRSAWKLLKPRK
jgi:cytoskeletal protein CcmA (bactofilin family)